MSGMEKLTITKTSEGDALRITKCDKAGDYTFSAWASDLGLKPGQWPKRLQVSGFGFGFGVFQHEKVLRDGSRIYRVPASKFTFTIYND